MKPYSPETRHGRKCAVNYVHHRTADQPKGLANRDAKALRHAARQEGRRLANEGDAA